MRQERVDYMSEGCRLEGLYVTDHTHLKTLPACTKIAMKQKSQF